MNFIVKVLSIFILCFFGLLSCSSSETSSSNSSLSTSDINTLLSDSITLLENATTADTILAAKENFETVLANDPNNVTANFYLISFLITDIALNDTVIDIASSWDMSFEGFFSDTESNSSSLISSVRPHTIASHILSTLTTPEIHLSQDAETIIEDVVLVELENTLGYIDTLLDIDDVSFRPHALNDSNVEIDATDLYVLRSMLSLLKSMLHITVAYDLTGIEESEGTYDDYYAFIDANPNILNLKSTGEAHMASAKNELIIGIESFIAGITSLENETDSQSDDVIKQEIIEDVDTDDIITDLTHFKSMINAPITVTFEIEVTDTETQSFEVALNFSALFDTPIESLQPYLTMSMAPTTEGDTSIYEGLDFSFGGLFPDLTSLDEWSQDLGYENTPLDFIQYGYITSIEYSDQAD